MLLSASEDEVVKLWRMDTGELLDQQQHIGGGSVTHMEFLGPLMCAMGGVTGSVTVYSLSDFQLVAVSRFKAYGGAVTSLRAHVPPEFVDEALRATASNWQDNRGRMPYGSPCRDQNQPLDNPQLSRDPALCLAVASKSGYLSVFRSSDSFWEAVHTSSFMTPVTCLCYSADGSSLLVGLELPSSQLLGMDAAAIAVQGSVLGQVKMINCEDWKVVTEWQLRSPPLACGLMTMLDLGLDSAISNLGDLVPLSEQLVVGLSEGAPVSLAYPQVVRPIDGDKASSVNQRHGRSLMSLVAEQLADLREGGGGQIPVWDQHLGLTKSRTSRHRDCEQNTISLPLDVSLSTVQQGGHDRGQSGNTRQQDKSALGQDADNFQSPMPQLSGPNSGYTEPDVSPISQQASGPLVPGPHTGATQAGPPLMRALGPSLHTTPWPPLAPGPSIPEVTAAAAGPYAVLHNSSMVGEVQLYRSTDKSDKASNPWVGPHGMERVGQEGNPHGGSIDQLEVTLSGGIAAGPVSEEKSSGIESHWPDGTFHCPGQMSVGQEGSLVVGPGPLTFSYEGLSNLPEALGALSMYGAGTSGHGPWLKTSDRGGPSVTEACHGGEGSRDHQEEEAPQPRALPPGLGLSCHISSIGCPPVSAHSSCQMPSGTVSEGQATAHMPTPWAASSNKQQVPASLPQELPSRFPSGPLSHLSHPTIHASLQPSALKPQVVQEPASRKMANQDSNLQGHTMDEILPQRVPGGESHVGVRLRGMLEGHGESATAAHPPVDFTTNMRTAPRGPGLSAPPVEPVREGLPSRPQCEPRGTSAGDQGHHNLRPVAATTGGVGSKSHQRPIPDARPSVLVPNSEDHGPGAHGTHQEAVDSCESHGSPGDDCSRQVLPHQEGSDGRQPVRVVRHHSGTHCQADNPDVCLPPPRRPSSPMSPHPLAKPQLHGTKILMTRIQALQEQQTELQAKIAQSEAVRKLGAKLAKLDLPRHAQQYSDLPPIKDEVDMDQVKTSRNISKQLHPGWVAARNLRPRLQDLWRPEEMVQEVASTRVVTYPMTVDMSEIVKELLDGDL